MAIKPIGADGYENILHYVAGRRYGYMSELKPFGEEAINAIKSVGFLKTGYTMEAETFGATDLLKNFYIAVYGKAKYIKQRIKSVVKHKKV